MEQTAIEFLCCSGDWEIVEAILDTEWVAVGVLGEAEACSLANIADVSGKDREVEGDGDGDVGEDIEGLDMSLGVIMVVTRVELGAEASEAIGDT